MQNRNDDLDDQTILMAMGFIGCIGALVFIVFPAILLYLICLLINFIF